MKTYNTEKTAETRCYNDCKKGVSTCPYRDEVLTHFWCKGFDKAWEEMHPVIIAEEKAITLNMKTLLTALSALFLLASCNEPQHNVTVSSILYGNEDAITTDSLVSGQKVWISYDLAGNHVAYNMDDKGNSIGHTAIVK